MKIFKVKFCLNCNKSYVPIGPCSKFCCIECRKECNKNGMKEYHRQYDIRTERIKNPGVGKGGSTLSGKENPYWKGGKSLHMKHRARYKDKIRFCERCNKDLKNATHYLWVMHHIDHNKTNNPLDSSNWELLCKRCHQIEHECWLAFEGATTIETTVKTDKGVE